MSTSRPPKRLEHARKLALALALFASTDLSAEDASPALLTLDRIFVSGELNGDSIAARWLDDASGYATLEPADSGGRDIVRHDPETGAREVLVPAADLVPRGEPGPLAIDDWALSKDRSKLLVFTNSKRVWRRNTRGDYWVLDRSSRELRRLGGDAEPSSLWFAKLSPDGGRVAYVWRRDLHVEDVRSGGRTALTSDGSDDVINGGSDWVYEEELDLRDGFRWSPDGEAIAYWQIDSSGVRAFPLTDNIGALYPEVRWFKYPKTGETNSSCRVGIVPAAGGATRWLEVPGDRRQHYIARIEWTPGSEALVVQQLNRLQNQNRVFLAERSSGEIRELFVETDACWVDVHDPWRWIEGGRRFTWWSERDGWRHLYLGAIESPGLALATPGGFDVVDLLGAEEGGAGLYFTASPERPTQRFLYRSRFDGSGLERVTPAGQGGTHDYNVSPDGRWALHTRSSRDEPPRTALVRLPGHEEVRELVSNARLRERFAALEREPTQFFRVDIGSGVLIDGYVIKPPGFDAAKKHPVLVYVYGEPWGQTVSDAWEGKHHLWHLMLAQRGYAVMSFDNRGTRAPRGREWRKSIHRQVGILASADQAAALKQALALFPWLDAERVAIWGWSGGGSMTLNALFRYPELYKTGMAVAPVPNMRLYDTIYQERYMGLPEDNVDGYRQGSPIHHARRLEGNLLLVHGTGDDNVHYQGTEQLVDELVRHGKRFTMMAYPNRSHSISEGAGTTRHLYDLLTSYLEANLPAGAR
jgi:dipeptidyl-peptidase-4